MAIRKQAQNMHIKVNGDYNLTVGKKLEKTTNKMNIEAQKGNLILNSNKKIVSDGDKKE